VTALTVDIDFKPKLKDIIRAINGDLKKVNVIFADKMLDEIELTQIHAYTSGGMPAKPGGSTYKRTFKLRASSKRRVKKVTFRTIQAAWFTDLDYAPYVLGSKSEQAEVHQGRWKSTEEVADSVNKNTNIYNESWNEAGIK